MTGGCRPGLSGRWRYGNLCAGSCGASLSHPVELRCVCLSYRLPVSTGGLTEDRDGSERREGVGDLLEALGLGPGPRVAVREGLERGGLFHGDADRVLLAGECGPVGPAAEEQRSRRLVERSFASVVVVVV